MMKPMLASAVEDVEMLNFPLLASPKIDGIRCVTDPDLGAVSRTLKSIPNLFIRNAINILDLPYLDGEIWIPGAANFGEVSSVVMKRDGVDGRSFEYHVFDHWQWIGDRFTMRLAELERRVEEAGVPWLKLVPQVEIEDVANLADLEEEWLQEGYEGVMLRDPNGRYKFGRSTLKEGLLLKLKRFQDAEAEIIGLEQEMENRNPEKTNALGRTERSSHKANLVGKGTLGALVCRTPEGIEFKIGTGFTAAERELLWQARALIGQLVKYKHQPHGAKEAPRCPVFLGIRSREDV